MWYKKDQIEKALKLLAETHSPTTVIDTLGYPSVGVLYRWRGQHRSLFKKLTTWKIAPGSTKAMAINSCINEHKPVKLVAKELGYSIATIYRWCDDHIKKGAFALMKKGKKTSVPENPEIAELKAQIYDLQLQLDIINATFNILKKDPGADQITLKNWEKTVVVDALKTKYPLPLLCKVLSLPKSSYYYQRKRLAEADKYLSLRKRIKEIFNKHYEAYGYRRIWQELRNNGVRVSEKVVCRIMKEENLTVKLTRRRKYNSYTGEHTPAPENLVQRNFHAEKKNQLWLTDITEFKLDTGKVYLSVIIDCFDGMPVAWRIGTSPNAVLANETLRMAIATLEPGEKPILHSDRGCHYRWPEWICITEGAGITRSMSQKGCSPDNAACEGFFGHLKTEMFYGCSWKGVSITAFIKSVDKYIHWYRNERIKMSLGGLSPMEYRRRLGIF